MNKVARYLPLVVFFSLFAVDASFAQGGLSQVNTFLTTMQTALTGFGIAVFTIALIWTGYKLMWEHCGFAEVIPKLIGAIVVASAAEIAGMFFG